MFEKSEACGCNCPEESVHCQWPSNAGGVTCVYGPRGFAPALRPGHDEHLSCWSEIEFKFIGRFIGIPLIGTVPEGIRVFTGRHGVSKIRLDMDDLDVLSAVFIDRLPSSEGKK